MHFNFPKKCPVCGGIPKLRKSKNKYYYECDGDCWRKSDKCNTMQEAIEAWNRRANDA